MTSLKSYSFVSRETPMSMELTRSEVVDVQEDISYTTYGFRVLGEQGEILYEYEDIDTQREFVERFLEFCVQSDVSAIHIPDLLEDYLLLR